MTFSISSFDKENSGVYIRPTIARMAELVDARDLKSLGLWLYEFDSRSGYQKKIRANISKIERC